MTDSRSEARKLMAAYVKKGDPTGWFEPLYRNAAGDSARIPWADMKINPNVANWLEKHPASARSGTALVIGCGLGDDAESLAERGMQVTAFDIAPTAVDWCRRRFPKTTVNYMVADARDPGDQWRDAFDFVLEAYTLQVLQPEDRVRASSQIARQLRPGGQLLVIARARGPHEPEGNLPWPLTPKDLCEFERHGLELVEHEDFLDGETPSVRRFRNLYKRPAR
jgi:SAM-dependent methyltransferase